MHELVDDDPRLGEPLVPGLPYLRAEAVHAVRHEMARTLDDVLAPPHPRAAARPRRVGGRRRRRRRAARPRSSAGTTPSSARQVKEYRAAVAAERDAADLPETALDASLGA